MLVVDTACYGHERGCVVLGIPISSMNWAEADYCTSGDGCRYACSCPQRACRPGASHLPTLLVAKHVLPCCPLLVTIPVAIPFWGILHVGKDLTKSARCYLTDHTI